MTASAAAARGEGQSLVLGEGHLAVPDVVAAARGAHVRLAPTVMERLHRARSVVERIAASDRPVYGLTTGLGAAVDTRLEADDLATFQRRAVSARAVGVGEPASTEEVRAMLFVRLAGICQGASGISPAFAMVLEGLLNAGVVPHVRRTGTLGEADLSPLAQAMLPLVGGGMATFRGEALPGPEALRRANLVAPNFGAKDGIALLSSNAFGIGIACLALHDAELVIDALTIAGALSLEAFRANLSPFEPRLIALRPALGQAVAAERILGLLAGSDLLEAGAARRIQDPLSYRCLAPVHGVAAERLAEASRSVEADLNGAGDSPAVLVGTGEIASTVGFDTTAIALSLEGLGLALSHAAALAAFRTVKLMSPAVSDLPRFLTPLGGTRTGFATVQKTISALESEIRYLAQPVGALSVPVADGIEDYAPMTPRVAEKTRELVRRLAALAAVELVVAAQAVDLRGGMRLGQGTRAAHRFVRSRIAFLDEDRPLGTEIHDLSEAILAGTLSEALAG